MYQRLEVHPGPFHPPGDRDPVERHGSGSRTLGRASHAKHAWQTGLPLRRDPGINRLVCLDLSEEAGARNIKSRGRSRVRLHLGSGAIDFHCRILFSGLLRRDNIQDGIAPVDLVASFLSVSYRQRAFQPKLSGMGHRVSQAAAAIGKCHLEAGHCEPDGDV